MRALPGHHIVAAGCRHTKGVRLSERSLDRGRGGVRGTFGDRVRALLRARPVADAADNAARQMWGGCEYDVVTFALAAIDAVIARQGFDHEVTYDEAVARAGRAGRRCPSGTFHR